MARNFRRYLLLLLPLWGVLTAYFAAAAMHARFEGVELYALLAAFDKLLIESLSFFAIISMMQRTRKLKVIILPFAAIWFAATSIDAAFIYFGNSRIGMGTGLLIRPETAADWNGPLLWGVIVLAAGAVYFLKSALYKYYPPQMKNLLMVFFAAIVIWFADLPKHAAGYGISRRSAQILADDEGIKRLQNMAAEGAYLRQTSLLRSIAALLPRPKGEFEIFSGPPPDYNLPLGKRNYPNLNLEPFTRIIFVTVESLSLDLLAPYNSLLPANLYHFYNRPEISGRMFTAMYSSAADELPALGVIFNSHPNPEIFNRAGSFPQSIVGFMRDGGYRTIHMRGTSDFYGVEDDYFSKLGFGEVLSRDLFEKFFTKDHFPGAGLPDRMLMQAAVERLKQAGNQPVFLHLLAADTQPPFGRQDYAGLEYPPLPFALPVPRESKRLFGSVLRHSFDIGLFVEMLRHEQLFDQRTLLVITADRCSPLTPSVRQIPGYPRLSLCPVPFLLLTPQALPAPVALDTPCSQVDIAPTIFHLLDLPIPASWWGQSLFDPEKNNALIGVFHDSLLLAGPVSARVSIYSPQNDSERELIRLFNSIYR